MAAINRTCSVCHSVFELHFRYQLEEKPDAPPSGEEAARYSFYCSQRCLEASHRGRADGQVSCDGCATRFVVELAAHVLFTGGRRHYACSPACRAGVLEGMRAVRLGQLLDPGYPLSDLPPEAGVKPAETEDLSASPLTSGIDAANAVEAAPAPIRPAAGPPPLPSSARRDAKSSAGTGATAVPFVPSLAGRAAQRSAPEGSPARTAQTQRSQRVLAVFNHKGGTGKTTTSVHVAAGLAARGQRVLLVDTDGQGNIATSLGLSFERSLYHVIVMGLDFSQAVVSARPNLDVVCSNETVAAAELYLAGQRQRDRVLAHRFAKAREMYDFVVVDCSPSLSLMNQNALVMADAVLCPVACDYLSLIGVQKVVRTIKQVNRLLSHQLGFWGVLPTFFDSRARICHEALDTMREHFKETCLEPIRQASRVKEAPSQGKTLFEYAPDCTAAQDYLRVVDRLLQSRALEQQPELAAGGVA